MDNGGRNTVALLYVFSSGAASSTVRDTGIYMQDKRKRRPLGRWVPVTLVASRLPVERNIVNLRLHKKITAVFSKW